jgi:hypothetical protein
MHAGTANISSCVMFSMAMSEWVKRAACSSSRTSRTGSSVQPVGMPPTTKAAASTDGIAATTGTPKVAPMEKPT